MTGFHLYAISNVQPEISKLPIEQGADVDFI